MAGVGGRRTVECCEFIKVLTKVRKVCFLTWGQGGRGPTKWWKLLPSSHILRPSGNLKPTGAEAAGRWGDK